MAQVSPVVLVGLLEGQVCQVEYQEQQTQTQDEHVAVPVLAAGAHVQAQDHPVGNRNRYVHFSGETALELLLELPELLLLTVDQPSYGNRTQDQRYGRSGGA